MAWRWRRYARGAMLGLMGIVLASATATAHPADPPHRHCESEEAFDLTGPRVLRCPSIERVAARWYHTCAPTYRNPCQIRVGVRHRLWRCSYHADYESGEDTYYVNCHRRQRVVAFTEVD